MKIRAPVAMFVIVAIAVVYWLSLPYAVTWSLYFGEGWSTDAESKKGLLVALTLRHALGVFLASLPAATAIGLLLGRRWLVSSVVVATPPVALMVHNALVTGYLFQSSGPSLWYFAKDLAVLLLMVPVLSFSVAMLISNNCMQTDRPTAGR